MSENSEILKQFIEAVKKDIQESEILHNGQVAKLIESESDNILARIYVPYWFSVFWEGRKPGTFPPKSKILSYIISIDLLSKIPDFKPHLQIKKRWDSLAFAICKTMMKEGNTLYRNLHGGTVRYNVKALDINTIITETRINNVCNLLANNCMTSISSEILNIK